MPTGGKKRRGLGHTIAAKSKKTSAASKSAKTGRFVQESSALPNLEVKLGGRGKLVLKNQGNGTFQVVEHIVPSRTRNFGKVDPAAQRARNEAAHRPQPQKIEPVYAHFYLQEADGLKALTVTKAMIDYLSDLGYGAVKILEAEQGSLWASIVAYWNGEGGDQARQFGKQKAKEGYQYAEQWAKDATVNKQMAEVTSTNASSIAALLESVADQDEAILHVGNLLVVKNNGKVIAKDLTVPEMMALQKHSGILKDPATVIQMLALVVAGGSVPERSQIEP